jgi:X-Pro dipeptidyl-peptidase C-terminal non-catalytic domain
MMKSRNELVPGEIYEVDVEVWPTCIVVPRGYRVALTVRAKDYVYGGESTAGSKTLGQKMDRCGAIPPRRLARPPYRGVRRRRDAARGPNAKHIC